MPTSEPIRVLIVDDSALTRRILSEALRDEPGIEVVGTAPNPIVALEKMNRCSPDVLTLDVEMPEMDGLTFLRQLMRDRPMPVIMISSVARHSSQIAIDALAEGAVEVIGKPEGPYSAADFKSTLAGKIRSAARARLRRRTPVAGPAPSPAIVAGTTATPKVLRPVRLIAIGASTGGTQAIEKVLRDLPAGSPPILIVQHIPAAFSKPFAERLDRVLPLHVREASEGSTAAHGDVLVAPGNLHMVLAAHATHVMVSLNDGPQVCYQRPAVDVLFQSIAARGGSGVVAVLLTGMGTDGALGLSRLKHAGAHTIAQDEASCAVFGMPREAIRIGAAGEVLSLDQIGRRLAKLAAEGIPTANFAQGRLAPAR